MNKIKQRITSVKFDPAGKKKDWKPVKTKLPDCATYEVGKGKDYVGKSQFIHRFAEPRGSEGAKAPKETFTSMAAKQKKHVPGVGSYTPSLSYAAIPYGRKRL